MVSRRRILQMVPAALAAQTAARALAATSDSVPSAAVGLTHASGEDRGIWIHPERSLITRDAKQGRILVHDMVSRYVDAGFNLLMPWTVSGYLMAVENASLQDAHPSASWDALAVLLEEADAQKVNVDIWYSFSEYRGPKSPEFDPKYVAIKPGAQFTAISSRPEKTRQMAHGMYVCNMLPRAVGNLNCLTVHSSATRRRADCR